MNTDDIQCVAGETPILTKRGYYPIQTLKDQNVEVWNGNEWDKVMVKQTASRRHLLTVFFSNGCSLSCTPDHKFIIGDGELKDAKRISTQFLTPGMKLRQGQLPIIDGTEPFLYPYLHGTLCGFGCFTEHGPIIDIMGPTSVSITNHPDMINDNGTKSFPENLPAPYLVPINSSIQIKLDWLTGFIDARSFINKLGLTLISINDKLILDIQRLLTTLGCQSFIHHNENVKVQLSEEKYGIVCNYNLLIPHIELNKLKELGLGGIRFTMEISQDSPVLSLVVKEIIDIGRLSPAYCFLESDNNAAIFNGILTSAS